MRTNRILVCALFVLSVIFSAWAEKEIISDRDRVREVVRDAETDKKGVNLDIVCRDLTTNVFESLREFLGDVSPDVRRKAIVMIGIIGKKDDTPQGRKESVDLLILGLTDTNSLVRERSIKAFLGFSRDDVTPDAKARIQQAMKISPNEELILACGMADIPDMEPYLLSVRTNALARYLPWDDPTWVTGGLKGSYWASLRASARMGNTTAIEQCIGWVSGCTNKAIKLGTLDTLEYVRQPKIVRYLISGFLMSDDDARGSDTDTVGTGFAWRATQILVKMVKDFPVRGTREEGEEYIERCRKWAKKNEHLEIRK